MEGSTIRKCTYPDCKCPFDMPDNECLLGLPMIENDIEAIKKASYHRAYKNHQRYMEEDKKNKKVSLPPAAVRAWDQVMHDEYDPRADLDELIEEYRECVKARDAADQKVIDALNAVIRCCASGL